MCECECESTRKLAEAEQEIAELKAHCAKQSFAPRGDVCKF